MEVQSKSHAPSDLIAIGKQTPTVIYFSFLQKYCCRSSSTMPPSRFEPNSIKNKIKREEIARKSKKAKGQQKLQKRLAQAKLEANDPAAKKVSTLVFHGIHKLKIFCRNVSLKMCHVHWTTRENSIHPTSPLTQRPQARQHLENPRRTSPTTPLLITLRPLTTLRSHLKSSLRPRPKRPRQRTTFATKS